MILLDVTVHVPEGDLQVSPGMSELGAVVLVLATMEEEEAGMMEEVKIAAPQLTTSPWL